MFPAEKLEAVNQTWHKICFVCGANSPEGGCKRVLTLQSYVNHGVHPFCKACHGHNFGPKGFHAGISAGAISSYDAPTSTEVSSEEAGRAKAEEAERARAEEAELVAAEEAKRARSAKIERARADVVERARAEEAERARAVELERIRAEEVERVRAEQERAEEEARARVEEKERLRADIILPTDSPPSKPGRFQRFATPCAYCKKSVFPAEKLDAVNQAWHKSCFVCGANSAEGGCKRVLTLQNYVNHGEHPFCKACHGRKFGPKGFHAGISASGMTTVPLITRPASEAAPEAGPDEPSRKAQVAYKPDEPLSTTQLDEHTSSEHLSILPATATGPSVPESNKAIPSPRGSISEAVATTTPATKQRFVAAGIKCAYCKKNVYPAEKLDAINQTWHKICFLCGANSPEGGCKRVLTLQSYVNHGEHPFCKACHGRNFGPKGFHAGISASGMTTVNPNQG